MSDAAPIYIPVNDKELRCNQGYILRQREWASYDEECLGPTCPHPILCQLKRRKENHE